MGEAVNLTHVDFAIDLSDGFEFTGHANFVVGPSFDDAVTPCWVSTPR